MVFLSNPFNIHFHRDCDVITRLQYTNPVNESDQAHLLERECEPVIDHIEKDFHCALAWHSELKIIDLVFKQDAFYVYNSRVHAWFV